MKRVQGTVSEKAKDKLESYMKKNSLTQDNALDKILLDLEE